MMMITYKTSNWGFRLKREGDNYWLGFLNQLGDELQETRITKEIYQVLKTYWRGDIND